MPLIRKMMDSVTPVQSLLDANALPDSGHKILSSDTHFRATLKWLQEEICDLLSRLPVNGFDAEHAEVLSVLRLSAEDTAHRFGTLTEGWDRLVEIKHKLLLPDDAVLARSAWLVSLIADFERSLREAICLTIECLGRLEFISKAAASTVTEQCIGLLPHAILRHEKTENAVAQAFSESMADGVISTLGVTTCFAEHLGMLDFKGDSFKEGLHTELKDLGSNSEEIILRLAEVRRAILHDTSSAGTTPSSGGIIRSNLGPLDNWDFAKLQVIAQFLYSYSIHYSLGVMDIVSRTVTDTSGHTRSQSDSVLGIDGKSPAVARYKASSELRVGTMVLLNRQLWWLAGSLADYLRERYEDGDGLMLRLNAAFAHSQLGIPREWKEEAMQINVDDKAPRYRLLKKSILHEWAGVDLVIKEALESGDMTLDELKLWPALAALRDQAGYQQAILEFGKLQPLRRRT